MGLPSKKEKDDEEQIHPDPSPRPLSQSQTQTRSASASIVLEPENKMDNPIPIDPSQARREVPIAVVEQRVSNLTQGALCLVLLTGPFLHLLHLIPRGM
jgi:hypothetical protein